MNSQSSLPNLTGQVAVVTGGGRGLGRAYAQALALAGASVAVAARTKQQLDETVEAITANGCRAIAVPIDVTDPKSVASMTRTVEDQLGPIDLLVNNAGIVSPLGPLWETDPDEWWRSLEINVRSVLLCSASVLPGMVQRRRGRIINLASGAGTVGIAYGSSYVTSKTAMIRMTETLAKETAEYGISVFAIHPGNVESDMTRYLRESAPGKQYIPWVRTIFDEGRDDPIEHSVQLVLALASGRADALSGCFITVNDDLDKMIQRAAEVKANDLYTLRIRTAQ